MFMTITITAVTAIAADIVIIPAKCPQAVQDTAAGITAADDSHGRLTQGIMAKRRDTAV